MTAGEVITAWGVGSLVVAWWLGLADRRLAKTPPSPVAASMAAHPSARRGGCPDAVTVRDGALMEVWL